MIGFVTSNRAATIDAMPEPDALNAGLQELCTLLSVEPATARQHCTGMQRISWSSEPYIWGGYAHAPPGCADARVALAKPEGGVLFFAGEATAHHSNPQTVHGAMESGWRAAREVMELEVCRQHEGVM